MSLKGLYGLLFTSTLYNLQEHCIKLKWDIEVYFRGNCGLNKLNSNLVKSTVIAAISNNCKRWKEIMPLQDMIDGFPFLQSRYILSVTIRYFRGA